MKTVIQVYTYKIHPNNVDSSSPNCGLGDCIRGTITLYKLSKIMNFNLIVDIRHHPISNFIEIKESEYIELIDNNIENLKFFFNLDNLKKYILDSFNESDIICLHANAYFQENDIYNNNTIDCFSVDEKNFIKNILIPNSEFKNYIDEKLLNISKKDNYNIIHFRLGDDKLYNSSNVSENDLNFYEDIFKRNYEENDILISDNKIFKDYIKLKYNVIVFDHKIAHLGLDDNYESVKGSLFDFFIQSKSKKIKTYTVYCWISGFVHWNCKLYNIPIEIIK
jgi:hypothetical protein